MPRPSQSGLLEPDVSANRLPRPAFVLIAAMLAACGAGSMPSPTVPPQSSPSLPPAPAATTASVAPSREPSAELPINLIDDEGTAVTLAAAPRRIVSLTPAQTEILFALGAGDQLVGTVEDPVRYPPAVAGVPTVGTFDDPDVEAIIGADADLVIAGGNGATPPAVIDRLRSLGVPVIVVYAPTVAAVLEDIRLTGAAIGGSAQAATLVTSMTAAIDRVAAATTAAPKPRVFYETGDQPSIYGIADDSVYAEMIELAGGSPITTGSASNWEMPVETLIAADPEVIVLGDSAYGVTAEIVAGRPGWATMSAVRTGAIRPINDILVTRPGPRLVEGLRLLAAAIHPELALPSIAPPPSGG